MGKTVAMDRPATLATGNPKYGLNLQQGFTLLEIMIVVALIGLLSSVVALNLTPKPDTRPDRFLRQIQLQMQSLTTQSMVQQRWYGVLFSENQYQLVRQIGTQWKRVGNNTEARTDLPNNFEAEKEGQPINLNQVATQPQILFSPDGNHSSFQLKILSTDQTYSLTDPYADIQ